MRKGLLGLGIVGLVLFFVLGAARAAERGPIKIGVPFGYTGWQAPYAKPMEAGIRLALEEAGGQFGGRSIQFIIEDTASDVNTGLTKIRKLVERDRVHFLLGIQSTGIANAARDYMARQGVPWVTLAAPAGFTREQFARNIFRVTPATVQYGYSPARWLANNGYKRVMWIGADYAAPREVFEAVKKVYGNNVVEALWTPQGTVDYAPYLAKITPEKADLLLVAMWGTDAVRLLAQIQETGLKGRLPVFGFAAFATELALPAMGKSVDGVLSSYIYCGGMDAPANVSFINAFKAKSGGQVPADYPYLAYMAGRIAFAALREIKGEIENTNGFIKALESVRAEGPMGTVSFDKKHGMVHDLYILKTSVSAAGAKNNCIGKIAQVEDPVDIFPRVTALAK